MLSVPKDDHATVIEHYDKVVDAIEHEKCA